MRADYPTNTTRGGASVYYEKCLALRVLNIVFLNEYINFELRIWDKTYNFAVLYISRRQYQDVFESFCEYFGRTLDSLTQNNFFLLVVIGYFNAKLPNWRENNQNKFEGDKFEHITSQFGSIQIIDDPTYILDSSSSYIDLIFTSQPDLVIESVVHHYIKTVIIRSFMLSLIYKFFILHHTVHKFGTSKVPLMI